jgi:hypothetical protein
VCLDPSHPPEENAMSLQPEAPTPAAAPAPSLSLFERSVAIFARPAAAWEGLVQRPQWWFPVLVTVAIQVVVMLSLYQRAYLPMYSDQLDAQIAAGAIDPAGAARAEHLMESPVMAPIIAAIAGVIGLIMTLVLAAFVQFGDGFIVGARLSYRLALEVTAWSGLVWLPQQLLFFTLAWSQQTMKGIHFGLAAFLPELDSPAKWHSMLTVLLDAISPFNVWYVVVAVLGCTALTGAPRRKIAWALGGMAVALAVIGALLSGLAPAS